MDESRSSSEIEITPEMIEAGAAAVAEYNLNEEPERIAVLVFRAMLERRPLPAIGEMVSPIERAALTVGPIAAKDRR